NNTFLGVCKVVALFPRADVETDFDPSVSGNHFELVNSRQSSMSSYVESDTPGDLETYNYDFAPVDIGQVHGIQINTSTYIENAPTAAYETIVNGTTVSSEGLSNTTSDVVRRAILEREPVGDAPWD